MLRRCIAAMLAMSLAVLPVWAAAASISIPFDTLTDGELANLYVAIVREMAFRGILPDGVSVSDDDHVWISKSGDKYHSISTCSNMKNPMYIDLGQVKSAGYEPCMKCNPPF